MRKALALIAAGLVAVYFIGKHRAEQRRQTDRAACEASSECLDFHAEAESLIQDTPVVSKTGARYFRGMRCTSSCDGHIAGFQWATANHIEERWQCTGNSESFLRGCHAYLDERELDILDAAEGDRLSADLYR